MRRHNTVREPTSGSAHVLHVPRGESPAEVLSDADPQEKARSLNWSKGQLLNVRSFGEDGYRVTLAGEEYDPRRPDLSLHFASPADCQNFVSAWYAPEGGGRPPWA